MGLPLVVPSGAVVRLLYSVAGQLAINTLGAIITGSPTFDQAMADRIGSAIKSVWGTNMGPVCPASSELVRVGVRDVRTANQTEFLDQGAPVTGAAIGDALPKQTALCITLRTAQSGKSARGRVYLPVFGEAESGADGTATLAAQTAGVSFLQAVDGTALTPEGMRLAVMTKPQEDVIVNEITTHLDGTTTIRQIYHQTRKDGRVLQVGGFESRDAEWETQRRRANGRGAAVIANMMGGVRLRAL